MKPFQSTSECSDDEGSSSIIRQEEGLLECPICWESFNIVENVPYILWCGHTLCKNCILGLQWAVVKFPTLPIQLPLFISCPWCNLLSFRLIYRGSLKFPRKNYFLLWMVESMNGDRSKSHCTFPEINSQPVWPTTSSSSSMGRLNFRREQNLRQFEPREESIGLVQVESNVRLERLHCSIRKLLAFFVHLTAKFPLVLIFLLIVVYVIPASAAVLALYVVVTIVFAVPAFLILYFAYPSLDWLLKEIVT